jgi:uncharacterized protein with HEPN domain
LRSDRERLLDILDAIERIRRQAARGRGAFDRDEVVQTAVIRWVEIIGEAVRGLSPQLRNAHPDVPWRQIVAMRNIVVHGYFDVDAEAIWSTVENRSCCCRIAAGETPRRAPSSEPRRAHRTG